MSLPTLATTSTPSITPVRPTRWPARVCMLLVSLVTLTAFGWPFVVTDTAVLAHSHDAPWLFAVLIAVLAAVLLAQLSSGGLSAKEVAVIGVLAAAGGALRVLSAGTVALEPMFVVLVLCGRVLSRSTAFVVGALAMFVGALLTGGVGPWLPFQMMAAGWVALGAGLIPRLASRLVDRVLVAAYGFVAGLGYGALMNLWFWPFLGPGTTAAGTGYVPGAGLVVNLQHYQAFYLLTSLAWDLPRAILTGTLLLIAGPALSAALRRGVRKADFTAAPRFESGTV